MCLQSAETGVSIEDALGINSQTPREIQGRDVADRFGELFGTQVTPGLLAFLLNDEARQARRPTLDEVRVLAGLRFLSTFPSRAANSERFYADELTRLRGRFEVPAYGEFSC